MVTKTNCYKYTNVFIKPGLVDELYEICKYWTLGDCARTFKVLHVDSSEIVTDSGDYLSIHGLIHKYNNREYAINIHPIWFYAGPELLQDTSISSNPFKLISGSVLAWVIDVILYEVSISGPKVLDRLEISL